MEMTFYDDSRNGKTLKRPATLDLDSQKATSKKQRCTSILTTPDLNMLALGSPEMEQLIMKGRLNMTPTPTKILFPKSVTDEQEDYARGFIDALNHLHQTSIDVDGTFFSRNNSENLPTSSTPGSKIYSSLMPFYLTSPSATSVIKSLGNVLTTTTSNPNIRPPSADNTNSSSCNSNSLPVPLEIAIKEEYQTVPSDYSTPPMSPISRTPINMEGQEKMKLERKRYRNRIAASKCRKRKLEKISQLEDKVKDLKGENSRLESVADRLREQVFSLKQTVLDHANRGCQIMVHKQLL